MTRNYKKLNNDNWLYDLYNNLEKSAVQPIRNTLFNQINTIMNGGVTSKFSTVEEMVEDMKNRSGLTAYLSKQSQENATTTKNASATHSFINNYPEVKNTIENIITSSRGTLSVPAIIEKIHQLHENDINDNSFFDDDRLIAYISHRNLKEKSTNFRPDNYTNLGKSDSSLDEADKPWNKDPFYGIDL